jgi:hypothetical protein
MRRKVSLLVIRMGTVDAGDDEVLDMVIRIQVRGDHHLKGKDHALPWAKQGLEARHFSRAGAFDRGKDSW